MRISDWSSDVCSSDLTGLLTGRAVTTHWAYADAFRDRFPEAKLDIDRLIIDGGDIISAGGLMAWTDLGLKLVERFLGPVAMAQTARMMLEIGRASCRERVCQYV